MMELEHGKFCKSVLLGALLALPAGGLAVGSDEPGLPYVYTEWEHFTVKNGLPNDHIFYVKVHGNDVWVGTEDGLALIDKQAGRVKQTWK
ncbi:MAG TPA: hypothetical protein PLM33_11025, partial [Acidobacteriota bacterium]|nr:hypothetical protein [Acidobacteriota bacterium]